MADGGHIKKTTWWGWRLFFINAWCNISHHIDQTNSHLHQVMMLGFWWMAEWCEDQKLLVVVVLSQQTQNINCITVVQRRPNVGPILYKCYTNVLSLLGSLCVTSLLLGDAYSINIPTSSMIVYGTSLVHPSNTRRWTKVGLMLGQQ